MWINLTDRNGSRMTINTNTIAFFGEGIDENTLIVFDTPDKYLYAKESYDDIVRMIGGEPPECEDCPVRMNNPDDD